MWPRLTTLIAPPLLLLVKFSNGVRDLNILPDEGGFRSVRFRVRAGQQAEQSYASDWCGLLILNRWTRRWVRLLHR